MIYCKILVFLLKIFVIIRPMKILNKYISKQILIGFFLVVFSLLAILWLTQSLKYITLVTSKGLPIYLFVEMTSLLMPRLFIILSPIAVFVASLFVYNRMVMDREIPVIQAAGIAPFQNAKPALIVGIIVAMFAMYVNNNLIFSAERRLNRLTWEVKNDASHLLFKEGEFTVVQPNLTVFITSHEKDGYITGILLNDERKKGTKVTLSAEKGRIVYTEEGPRIILVNGSRQEVNTSDYTFSSLTFERYSVDFGNTQQKKQKDAGVREKSLKELFGARKDASLSEAEIRKYLVEGNKRLLSPLYNLLFALLGCTGLLVGNFNRRGQTKIVLSSVVVMVLIQAGDLAFTNMSQSSLYFLSLLYGNYLLPFFVCVWLLLFYNPNYSFMRKKRN